MSQQNKTIANSSNHTPITTTANNIELKRRDLDYDRDTGDVHVKPTTITTSTNKNRVIDTEFKDEAVKIVRNGIDKSKEILASIKSIFKL